MNTHIVISLDKRKTKKDGSYPLIMRVTHFRKTTSIPTGISVKKEYWDEKKRQIKKGFDGVSSVNRLNNQLAKKKAEAMDVITALDEKGELPTLSVAQLKARISRQNNNDTLFNFSASLITDFEEAKRFGTALSYKDTIRAIKKFTKDRDLTFPQITYTWLTQFEKNYIAKGNSYNALGVYMRTLRAIFNKAIKSGIVEKSYYPFDQYRIKTEKTRKRAVSLEMIQRILALKLKPKDELFHARNYFLASYMMYGMNFADMAQLKMSNIMGDRILYKRQKTGKPYDVKITDKLSTILSYYTKRKRKNDFIFPIVKREAPEDQYKDMMWARKNYNKALKEIAQKCDIEKTLTSYVSRHSFATEALLKNVPVTAISAMLGHSSLSTTEVYLKGLPNDVLDDYNEWVTL